MSVNGSAAQRASASLPHGPTVDPSRTARDRRRIGSRTRTRRSPRRDLGRTAANGVQPAEDIHGIGDALTEAFEDGLDPAFDEFGELHEQVDGLSAWTRLGRVRPGRQDD